MNTVRDPIGVLARQYRETWRAFRDAEDQVESLVLALYNSTDFEIGDDGIDIYEALDSQAMAAAMHRAGFRFVRCHGHTRGAFKSCACVIRRDLL